MEPSLCSTLQRTTEDAPSEPIPPREWQVNFGRGLANRGVRCDMILSQQWIGRVAASTALHRNGECLLMRRRHRSFCFSQARFSSQLDMEASDPERKR